MVIPAGSPKGKVKKRQNKLNPVTIKMLQDFSFLSSFIQKSKKTIQRPKNVSYSCLVQTVINGDTDLGSFLESQIKMLENEINLGLIEITPNTFYLPIKQRITKIYLVRNVIHNIVCIVWVCKVKVL